MSLIRENSKYLLQESIQMSLARENSNVSYKREFKCFCQERIQKSQERIQMSLTRENSNVFDKREFKCPWQENSNVSDKGEFKSHKTEFKCL